MVQVSSVLSVLGAGFIILSYILFPASRKFSRKLLVYLTIADIVSAGTWFWSTYITTQLALPSSQCIVQGFSLQFFYLSSYVWTSCFAFHIYQLIWKKNTTKVCSLYCFVLCSATLFSFYHCDLFFSWCCLLHIVCDCFVAVCSLLVLICLPYIVLVLLLCSCLCECAHLCCLVAIVAIRDIVSCIRLGCACFGK